MAPGKRAVVSGANPESNVAQRCDLNEDASSVAHNNVSIDVEDIEGRENVKEKQKTSSKLPWWSCYKEVWMSTVMSKDYVPEETRLHAVLLQVKKNESNRLVSIYSGKGGKTNPTFGTSGNNRDVFYDRMLLFGCLGVSRCFIIITYTSKRSGQLLQTFAEQNYCVGQTVVLLEPIYTEKNLGKNEDLPIFDIKDKIEPYRFPVLQQVEFIIPKEPSTRYFMLHGVTVEIIAPTIVRSTCGGTLCDRQITKGNEKGCACLFNSATSSLVMEMTARVFVGGELVLEAENFRSWLLTNLFIGDLNMTSSTDDFQAENKKKMRGVIKTIVKYVNERGGWTVYGWMRRGTQLDAAEKGKQTRNTITEEITSEHVSPHIIRLMPYSVPGKVLKDFSYQQPAMHLSLI
jgi:hypothetical protein